MKIIKTNIDAGISWAQVLVIALLAPNFLFPSMNRNWLFLIVPALIFIKGILTGHFIKRSPLDWAVCLLAVQVLLACIFSPDLSVGLSKIVGILFGILTFYSLINLLKSERLIKLTVIIFIFGGFIFSIIALWGMDWWSSFSENILQNTIVKISTFIPKIHFILSGNEYGFNSNAIAETIVLFLPLNIVLIAMLFNKNELFIRHRLWNLIGLIFISLSICCILFLTMSIGSIFALYISIAIFLFPKKWRTLALLLPSVLFIFFIFIKNPSGNSFFEVGTKKLIDKIETRKPYWQIGINAARQHPFVGVGLNRIRQILPGGSKYSHVHNHFLHTAAELGVPGLISLIAILFGTGMMIIQIFRHSRSRWTKSIARGLACGQFAYLLTGIVDSIPLGAKVGIFFWISLAIITGLYGYTQIAANE